MDVVDHSYGLYPNLLVLGIPRLYQKSLARTNASSLWLSGTRRNFNGRRIDPGGGSQTCQEHVLGAQGAGAKESALPFTTCKIRASIYIYTQRIYIYIYVCVCIYIYICVCVCLRVYLYVLFIYLFS